MLVEVVVEQVQLVAMEQVHHLLLQEVMVVLELHHLYQAHP